MLGLQNHLCADDHSNSLCSQASPLKSSAVTVTIPSRTSPINAVILQPQTGLWRFRSGLIHLPVFPRPQSISTISLVFQAKSGMQLYLPNMSKSFSPHPAFFFFCLPSITAIVQVTNIFPMEHGNPLAGLPVSTLASNDLLSIQQPERDFVGRQSDFCCYVMAVVTLWYKRLFSCWTSCATGGLLET